MPLVLADLAEQVFADLPPFMESVPDFRAAVHAMSREIELFEDAQAELQRNLFVQTADEHIGIYLTMLGINADPTLTIEQQKALAQSYFIRSRGGATEYPATENPVGTTLDDLIGSGWSIQEHVEGDGATPATGHTRFTLPDAAASPEAARKRILVQAFLPANLVIDWLYADTATFDQDNFDSNQNFA